MAKMIIDNKILIRKRHRGLRLGCQKIQMK